MPNASYIQPSFSGGEWAPSMQGRLDHKSYTTAMNSCLNAYPTETGAWTRRPGTVFAAHTRNGLPGRLIKFDYSIGHRFTLELTDGFMRIFAGSTLVKDGSPVPVVDITPDAVAQVTVGNSTGFSAGDQVQFIIRDANPSYGPAVLTDRVFNISSITGGVMTLADSVTGEVLDGRKISYSPSTMTLSLAKILNLPTPWTDGAWATVVSIRLQLDSQNTAVLVNGTNRPQVLAASPSTSSEFTTFTLSDLSLIDGPYLDPVAGAQLNCTGKTGVITAYIGYQAFSSTQVYSANDFVGYLNQTWKSLKDANIGNIPADGSSYWTPVAAGGAVGDSGFTRLDVGRHIRMHSEPEDWIETGTYAAGTAVKYANAYYTAHTGVGAGIKPDSDLTRWQIAVTAHVWTWGRITEVLSASMVKIQLIGPDLLYTATPVKTWMAGAYSDQVGYPSCGLYHQGRLWFSGPFPNRFDASQSNLPTTFSLTDQWGTVGDASGITYTMNSSDLNHIFWMYPGQSGLVMGSDGGEWLIQASQLSDPITPTSIQAYQITKYRCAEIQPVKVGPATIFVQREKHKVLELLPNAYTGRYDANNLAVMAPHLTKDQVLEIAYQEESTPILWCRTGSGQLIGSTYSRTNAATADGPQFNGWHQHILGSGNSVISVQVIAGPDGKYDTLCMVTQDASGVCSVELLSSPLADGEDQTAAWYLDCAVTPSGVKGSSTGATFYGLNHLEGQTVAVWAAGVDCGDFTVTNGSVFVPYSGLFTHARLEQMSSSGQNFGALATELDTVVTVIPARTQTTGSILSYNWTNPAYAVHPQSIQNTVFDWDNGFVYTVRAGTGDAGVITQFRMSDGAILREATGTYISQNLVFHGLGEGEAYNRWVNSYGMTLGTRGMTVPAGGEVLKGSFYEYPSSDYVSLSGLITLLPDKQILIVMNSITEAGPRLVRLEPDVWQFNAVTKYRCSPTNSEPVSWLTGVNPSDPNTILNWWTNALWVLKTPYYACPLVIYDRNKMVINDHTDAPPLADGVIHAVALSGDNGRMTIYLTNVAIPAYWGQNGAVIGSPAGVAGLSGYANTPGVAQNLNGFDYETHMAAKPMGGFTKTDLVPTYSELITGFPGYPYPFPGPEGSVYVCHGNGNDQAFRFWSISLDFGREFLKKSNDTPPSAATIPWQVWAYGFLGNGTTIPAIDCAYGAPGSGYFNTDRPGTKNSGWFTTAEQAVLEGNWYATDWKQRQLFDIHPTDINQFWSGFVGVNPYLAAYPVVDALDGNFIMTFQGTLSAAGAALTPQPPTTYLVKINQSTGKVVWKLDCPAPTQINPYSRIKGVMGFFHNSTYYTVDTKHGVLTSGTVPETIVTDDLYAVNSDFGWVIQMSGASTASTRALKPLYNTPPTFSDTWARVDMGGRFRGDIITQTRLTVPVVIGKPYVSRGQILRPQVGAATGPALFKVGRTHRYGALLVQAQNVQFGIDFGKMHSAPLLLPDDKTPAPLDQLYSGMFWSTLQADYGLNQMVCWQVSRGYPATVCSVGGFISTQDM